MDVGDSIFKTVSIANYRFLECEVKIALEIWIKGTLVGNKVILDTEGEGFWPK